RPRAGERARSERDRDLERGADRAGGLRPGRGRAGRSARLAGGVAVGVPRPRRRPDRPTRAARAARRLDRVAARIISEALQARYGGDREQAELLLAPDGELGVFDAAAFGRRERLAELLSEQPEIVYAFSSDGFST